MYNQKLNTFLLEIALIPAMYIVYLSRENELDEDNWPSRHLKSCQKDDILQDVGRVGEEDLGKEMGDESEDGPGEESGDLLKFHC